jgi:3-oxoacyl-[acyl-carrier protein] reductase
MDINTWVAVNLTKLFLTDMVSKKWGRIINIASIYGREFGGSAPYMAAKSALIAITKHTAIDLAKTGVTANCIAPGSIIHNKGSWEKFVENNSQETVNDFIKSNLPMGKFGYPEAVGDTVAFLASKNASMILGTCINVDGGQSNSLI